MANKENEIHSVNLNIDTDNHEIVFCDIINEFRIGDTYYLTGIQMDPLQKNESVKNKSTYVDALKKVTFVMDKETFCHFLKIHLRFIKDLNDVGILKDDKKNYIQDNP